MDLSTSWAKADFAEQRKIADRQLRELRRGKPPPVFASFISLMKQYVDASQGLRFLDCACSSGYYLDVIQSALDHHLKFTGSDMAESAIAMARARHPASNWSVASITALPFEAKSFDIVMAAAVLEHVPQWDLALNEIARVASRHVILHRIPIARTGKYQAGHMETYGIPTSRHEFAFHDLIEVLASQGFLLVNSLDSYCRHDVSDQTILFTHRSFI